MPVYILIFFISQFQHPGGVGIAEFNTMEACQAAAKAIKSQVQADAGAAVPVLVCAAKGIQKGSK